MIAMHIIVLLVSFFLYRSDPMLGLVMYMGVTCMAVFSWMSNQRATILTTSSLIVVLLGLAKIFIPLSFLWGAFAAWLLQRGNIYLENPEETNTIEWPEGFALSGLVLLLIGTSHHLELTAWPFLIWSFVVFIGYSILVATREAAAEKEGAGNAVQADATDEHRNVAKNIEVPSEHATTEKKAAVPPHIRRESKYYWFFDNPTSRTYRHAVKYLRDNVSSYPIAVQPTLLSIATSTEKILSCMEEDPLEKEFALRFLHHFLPSVFSLADKHTRLFKEQAMGEDSLALALEKSAAMLERLKKAFAKKYFKMLNNKITDLSVEINTLDTMLKMRGM